MSIEGSFASTLRKLRQGDISFYSNDSDCIMFARYIATQCMRTKGIKVRMIETFQRANGIDISRIWDVLSLISGSEYRMQPFPRPKAAAIGLASQ